MEENQTDIIRTIIKEWVSLDDRQRELKQQVKQIQDEKNKKSESILEFMRSNEVDNFSLEGAGIGNISRSVRTTRPKLNRTQIRTKVLIQFADQPQRAAELLRMIEGVEGEDMSVGGTSRELLVRHIPRPKKTVTI